MTFEFNDDDCVVVVSVAEQRGLLSIVIVMTERDGKSVVATKTVEAIFVIVSQELVNSVVIGFVLTVDITVSKGHVDDESKVLGVGVT